MIAPNTTDCQPLIPSHPTLSNSACKTSDDKIIYLFPLKAPIKLPKPSVEEIYEDFSISQFIRFLRRIKLQKILSNITELRNQNKINYANHIFLQWALSAFFFRRGSKNSLQTALDSLKPTRGLLYLTTWV